MKNSFKNWIAASLIVFGAVQVNAASITGTIQLTRDSSRKVNGAYLVTEKKDASGKPLALVLVLDENGNAIAQQYENKQIRIDGNVQGRNLTAIEWKEVRDNSYNSSSSYSDSSSSSRSSSYDDDEEEKESEEEVDEEENEDSDQKKSSKSSKKSKKKSDDDDEDSEDSDNEDRDKDEDSEEKEDSDDSESEEKEDSDDSESEEKEESDDD